MTDAALEAESGPARDASLDAGAGGDTRGDAPLVSDAGAWCASQVHHLFCDDFDENPLLQFWAGADTQHGTVTLDSASYASPFHSFLATSTALGKSAVASVRLGKAIVEAATELHISFALRPSSLDPSGVPVVALQIQLLDVLSQVHEVIELSLSSSGASLDDFAPAADGGPDFDVAHPLSRAPGVGQWTTVKIDLLVPAEGGVGNGTVTLYVGDLATPLLDHVPMAPTSAPSFPYLFMGVAYAAGPAAPFALAFDNVTVDIQQ